MAAQNSAASAPSRPALAITVSRSSRASSTRLARLISTFLILFTFSSPGHLTEALKCTYPTYNTEVQPGEASVLAWEATQYDVATYDKITATLYCMDINGYKGGVWRTATTLFQNRGLVGIQDEFRYSVPDCGRLARNVAIRIVAKSGQTAASETGECYFAMNPVAILPPPPSLITTTTKSVLPTTNPPTTNPPTTNPPPTVTPSVSITTTTAPPTSQRTTSNSISTTASDSSSRQSSVSGTPSSLISNLPINPYPTLPPLPNGPGDGSGPNDGGGSGPNDSGGSSISSSGGGPGAGTSRNMTAIFASIGAAAALVAIISLMVLRRRQTRRRRGRELLSNNNAGGSKRDMKEWLRLPGFHMKGSNKDQAHHSFTLMKEEDDGGDDNNGHGAAWHHGDPAIVGAAPLFMPHKSHPLTAVEAGSSEKQPSATKNLGNDILSETHDRNSSLLCPPDAHLDRSWRKSDLNLYLNLYTNSDDDFTMSSMRSSCETSSVVREYWAASMAARAERRLEGFPPSRNCLDEGSFFEDHQNRSPSFSSESRKADILSLDTSSYADSYSDAAGVRERPKTQLSASPSGIKESIIKRHYRNTVNSIHGYLRRSMSMSLTSLRSGVSSSDNDSWHYQRGFRSSISAEYLDHLNIKSLRSEQRQLAYYGHYYRQNPTMSTVDGDAYDGVFAVVNRSRTRTMTTMISQRTSSAPSLTSTNDPFQTFDSNEILSDLSPFSDQHAVPVPAVPTIPPEHTLEGNSGLLLPPSPLLTTVGNQTAADRGRSNSGLLSSFPPPPVLSSDSSSTSSSRSSTLITFLTPLP
ncbi:hypothetical protein EDD11_007435 [Mortierella claussenii]|nr:hypothetical protein EDD11_007435 [Mortierella claussenii]